jgi:hypothetical protein
VRADKAVRVDGRLDAEVVRPRRIEAAGLNDPERVVRAGRHVHDAGNGARVRRVDKRLRRASSRQFVTMTASDAASARSKLYGQYGASTRP